MMFRIFVVSCLAALTVHPPARAASFDCTKASAPREKVICSDPALSAEDSQLDDLYVQALRRLSADGGMMLQVGQHEWLHFLGEACPIRSSIEQQTGAEAASCLSSKYTYRVRDLEQVAIRNGPFLFNRVDHYSVTHLSVRTTQYDPGLAIHHTSYPQIDQPVSAVTTLWNEMMVRTDQGSSCDAGAGDTTTDYRLGLATGRLINVLWTTYEYCHGTPHGFGTSRNETFVLVPYPLEPADLFQPAGAWRERLTNLTLAGVRTAALAGNYDVDRIDEGYVSAVAPDPQHWNLRPERIALVFDTYLLGLGRPFNPDVIIPWSDLRDLMVPDPPVH